MSDIDNNPKLTTAAGAPVVDNQNSMTAGPRGPLLMQDVWLLEKLAHFDREVIPERRMHAKGSAAYGAIETILKGVEVALGGSVACAGMRRCHVRRLLCILEARMLIVRGAARGQAAPRQIQQRHDR